MKCPNCKRELNDISRFCKYCGADLSSIQSTKSTPKWCGNCGTPIEKGSIFCPQCGAPLYTPPNSESELQNTYPCTTTRNRSATPYIILVALLFIIIGTGTFIMHKHSSLDNRNSLDNNDGIYTDPASNIEDLTASDVEDKNFPTKNDGDSSLEDSDDIQPEEKNKKILRYTITCNDGDDPSSVIIYDYDSHGNRIKETNYYKKEDDDNSMQQSWSNNYKLTYDEEGNLVSSYMNNEFRSSLVKYDTEGNVTHLEYIEKESESSSGFTLIRDTTYDKNGYITSFEETNNTESFKHKIYRDESSLSIFRILSNGEESPYCEYDIDNQGQLKLRKSYSYDCETINGEFYYDDNGNVIDDDFFDYNNEYDEDGYLTKQVKTSKKNGEDDYVFTYTYLYTYVSLEDYLSNPETSMEDAYSAIK